MDCYQIGGLVFIAALPVLLLIGWLDGRRRDRALAAQLEAAKLARSWRSVSKPTNEAGSGRYNGRPTL